MPSGRSHDLPETPGRETGTGPMARRRGLRYRLTMGIETILFVFGLIIVLAIAGAAMKSRKKRNGR
jgi:hypothetical protein